MDRAATDDELRRAGLAALALLGEGAVTVVRRTRKKRADRRIWEGTWVFSERGCL
jgi:hypothetical protein